MRNGTFGMLEFETHDVKPYKSYKILQRVSTKGAFSRILWRLHNRQTFYDQSP